MWKENKSDGVLSFFGADTRIEGTITFSHSIRIDGTVKGDIISENGAIVVGQTADVTGDIRVGTATIIGTVNGKIIARERVDAYPPARIKGDITAPHIDLEEGVQFSGNCEISPKGMPE